MSAITLSGIVGWDIYTSSINRQLKEADGKDITVFLDSVGGSVFEGIKIYNLFKNYSGKTTVVMSGICASMGSYIPMAFDEILIEENAVLMIHNPWNYSCGDYRDMQKSSEILKGLRNLLSQGYAKKTSEDEKAIKLAMDEESWYFGSQIIEKGYADGIYKGECKIDEETKKKEEEDSTDYESRIKATVKFKLEDAKSKVKELDDENEIKSILNITELKNINNVVLQNTKTEVVMNVDKLKAEYPELYASVLEMGVRSEKERVEAHMTMADVAKDLVLENIKSGASFTDQKVQAKYLRSNMEMKVAIDMETEENDDVNTDDSIRNQGDGADVPIAKTETVDIDAIVKSARALMKK